MIFKKCRNPKLDKKKLCSERGPLKQNYSVLFNQINRETV
ncbi:hypothetical protein TcasGA2_TC032532 [Tribolium castaneum]|uniref:Uncharacterized protein n=1 Tax=Tribolium castaneum TaxID=7070 RepID=A0A139WKP4_TRICA|nr:hypothetical protein TcasGA2_TC032532 [Tribolium castaneum]